MPELSSSVQKLMAGATSGNLQMVRDAILDGVDVNARDLEGMTALMRAAQDGYSDVLRFLLSIGAEINATDPANRTALGYAIGESGCNVSVELLFEAGGTFSFENISWSSVGMPAFSKGYNGQPPIKSIVQRWVTTTSSGGMGIGIDEIFSKARNDERALSKIVSAIHKLSVSSKDQRVVVNIYEFMELLMGDGLDQCLEFYDLLELLENFQKIGAIEAAVMLEAGLRAAHDGELPASGKDLHDLEPTRLKKLSELESELSSRYADIQRHLIVFVRTNKETINPIYKVVFGRPHPPRLT